MRSRLPALSVLLAVLLSSGAALAEPDITGMWALSQPEGQTKQPPPSLTPEAQTKAALTNKISAQRAGRK